MTFNIEFDYRFDETGFFDDPQRRETLELAGQFWSSILQDDFAPVFSAGESTQVSISSISYTSPTEYTISSEFQLVTLEQPIDDLLIFVHGLALPPNSQNLGSGGPSGNFIIGSDEERRFKGDDFEPWIGSIYFNSSQDFFFDTTIETNDVPDGQTDFFTLALHEIGHVLGLGTSEAFMNLVTNQEFVGTQSLQLTDNQPIPIADDFGHIEQDFIFNGESDLLMKPQLYGTRVLPTLLDVAMLEDIGYESFDAATYLASYDDLLQAFGNDIETAAAHYLSNGILEKRSLDLFDPDQYLASYRDLLTAFGNDPDAATQHFLNYGYIEGRLRDIFQEDIYLASYDDLIEMFGYDLEGVTQYYLDFGAEEGKPIDVFNPAQYLASYDDLLFAFGNNYQAATRHFIEYGYKEGRLRDAFQADIYLACHGDLIQAFGYDLETATQHYIQHGVYEGRAKDCFDPVAYLNKYEDLQLAFGNDTNLATQHYINYGFFEDRTWM